VNARKASGYERRFKGQVNGTIMEPDRIEAARARYEQAAEHMHENLRRVAEADTRKAERMGKLEELVEELLVVYYHQDDEKISRLREELGI
jgi:hypothetical protein